MNITFVTKIKLNDKNNMVSRNYPDLSTNNTDRVQFSSNVLGVFTI